MEKVARNHGNLGAKVWVGVPVSSAQATIVGVLCVIAEHRWFMPGGIRRRNLAPHRGQRGCWASRETNREAEKGVRDWRGHLVGASVGRAARPPQPIVSLSIARVVAKIVGGVFCLLVAYWTAYWPQKSVHHQLPLFTRIALLALFGSAVYLGYYRHLSRRFATSDLRSRAE